MTTFKKKKFKISDDQTNIEKYELAANITTNHYYKPLWFTESFEVNFNIGFGIPSNFQVKECFFLFISVHKQEIGHLWSSESFELKYNIRFESPSNFQFKEKKIVKSVHKQEIGHLWSSESLKENKISDLESPSNFQVKEKKLSNRSINKKLDFCGPVSHLR